MITIKEIAKICSVSPGTVSNILNGRKNVGESTRQKVLKCVEETGYRPNYFAQNMRNQKNRLLSIITEDLTVFGTNPVVEAIMAYCDDNNYRTMLMNLRLYRKWRDTWYENNDKVTDAVKPYLMEAMSIRASGIIYVAGHCRVIDCFPKDFPIPIVISYGLSKDNKFHSVIIDDEKGGYDTAKYLISKGHKNVGIIAGAADNQHTIKRLAGYQKAFYEDGVLFNPNLVYYGDWKRSSGYLGAKHLINKDISAFFCMNDAMAVGAYSFIHEQGLEIGKDISIIGYDNMEFSDCLFPALTTNEIRLSEIGRTSAELMITNIEEKDEGVKTIKVPCRLIERMSVVDISRRAEN